MTRLTTVNMSFSSAILSLNKKKLAKLRDK